MSPGQPDDAALDDPAALAELDRDGMLLAVATAGAQVREALVLVEPETLATLAGDRPARRRGHRDGRLRDRRRRRDRCRRPDLPGARGGAPGPPPAGLGRPDGPGGGRVLLGRHRGDAVGHRRGAATGRPGGHGRCGRFAARRPQRRRPGAAPAGRRARPDAAGEPVGTGRPGAHGPGRASGWPTSRGTCCPGRPTSWTGWPSTARPRSTAWRTRPRRSRCSWRAPCRTSGGRARSRASRRRAPRPSWPRTPSTRPCTAR